MFNVDQHGFLEETMVNVKACTYNFYYVWNDMMGGVQKKNALTYVSIFKKIKYYLERSPVVYNNRECRFAIGRFHRLQNRGWWWC